MVDYHSHNASIYLLSHSPSQPCYRKAKMDLDRVVRAELLISQGQSHLCTILAYYSPSLLVRVAADLSFYGVGAAFT